MTELRVAVVGAGPAGATAARLLASRGAAVTLFETRRLPRPKLCGGGLTPNAARLVPAVTLQTVERRELRAREAAIAMVDRSRFDEALAAAADAGAIVRDGEPVRDAIEDASGVTVLTTTCPAATRGTSRRATTPSERPPPSCRPPPRGRRPPGAGA